MIEYQFLNTTDFVTTLEKDAIVKFLMNNLGEYSDTHDNVSKAIEYALSKFPHQGGFVVLARSENKIVGVCVNNTTNFEGYFAENILVFLTVTAGFQGQGIGKELLKRSMVYAKGSILIRLKEPVLGSKLFTRVGFMQNAREFLLKR
ncbi:MAG: GNAT family N-acetyltransferase [Flavobacteriales bacterium]|nr:GNAT family N-acetyltransferase [Flavobacteriales bacterium]